MLNAVDLSGAGIVDLSAMLRPFIDQEFSEGERRQVGEARACLVRKSPEGEQVFAHPVTKAFGDSHAAARALHRSSSPSLRAVKAVAEPAVRPAEEHPAPWGIGPRIVRPPRTPGPVP